MYKIQTLNNISIYGLERFSREKYEIASEISGPDAILVRSQQLQKQHLTPSLKAIARAGAGVNNIPVKDCSDLGIVVFNTPGANANAVKELVMAGMLLSSRGILEGLNYVHNDASKIKDYAEMNKVLENEKKKFQGQEIRGKTLGIVGLGAIGSLVADMALEMGMKVLGYDPAISVDAAWRLSSEVVKMENLISLLSKSDYISLHLPVLESTRNLINKETIKSIKPKARLLNFSRGEIVDNEAVVESLNDKVLYRYITDFPHPLIVGRPDVITMPHIGASTAEAEDNCAVMAADQVIDYLENGNVKNSVNFPDLNMERSTRHRICLVNSNVPKMLGKFMAVIADRNLNVVDLLNKSRNDLAYNIIDVDTPVPADLLPALKGIEGVINVRIL